MAAVAITGAGSGTADGLPTNTGAGHRDLVIDELPVQSHADFRAITFLQNSPASVTGDALRDISHYTASPAM